MIEPQALELPNTPGLDTSGVGVAAGTGVHVIVGRNNSGKTRLLEALHGAMFFAELRPGDYQRSGRFIVQEEWARLPTVRLRWNRSIPDLPEGFPLGQIPAGQVVFAPESLPALPGEPAEEARRITGELWLQFRRRPAILVPTDRYFDQQGATTDAGSLAPTQLASLLANRERSEDPGAREQFRRVVDTLAEVSDGLRLTARGLLGAPAQSVIYIVEEGAAERRLDDCGDGLRDLVMILLYSVLYPSYDLLLDEPGLRLHPHAQRRLLKYLDSESRERAVWIATHDGPFIGHSGVARRFYVNRAAGVSTVKELLDRIELQEAQTDLGWLPGDAFLADHVLFCEGSSDRAAFEAAVAWLAADDVTWAGTVVSDLGGDAIVWEGGPELRRRVDLVKRVAPYAHFSVLVDRGQRADPEVEHFRRTFEGWGISFHMLPVPELENLWLEVPLVGRILSAVAQEATARRGVAVVAPGVAEVREVLGRHNLGREKGSDVLEDVCRAHRLRFNKEVAARTAVAHIRDDAPAMAGQLREAVAAALRALPPAAR